MMEQDDAVVIDESFRPLLEMLLSRGITLKQKHGYKAGKLTATRNWCQFMDADMHPRVCFPNSQGQVKTWKLFARFDASQPPSWPWDRPSRCGPRKAPGMISGDDVWGLAYKDIAKWTKSVTSRQLLERMTSDLQISFNYSLRRYR